MRRFPTLTGLIQRVPEAPGQRYSQRRWGRVKVTVFALLVGVIVIGGNGQAASAHTVSQAKSTPAQLKSGGTYTIKSGETLSAIALRHRVSVSSLVSANGIVDQHQIFAGRTLRIPAGSLTSTTSASLPSVRQTSLPAPPRQPLRAVSSAGEVLPPDLRARPERMALRPRFRAAAAASGVPLDLLSAVTWQESGWQNSVRSTSGAVGIGQLMPDTVTFVNEVLLRKTLDPRNTDDNIRLSAAFLSYLLKQNNGDQSMAIAAYYQGLASVRRIGLYDDTKLYVQNVQSLQRVWF